MYKIVSVQMMDKRAYWANIVRSFKPSDLGNKT